MLGIVTAYLIGFISCLFTLYLIGVSRHKGHEQKMTGPSSKSQTRENVVAITRKG